MSFWGWRQTAWMAFISVIVVACTDTAPIPPISTPTPRTITLTVQGSPGAPPATARPTLAAVTATPKEPDAASVDILAPHCADTVSDGYQCVGTVHNITTEQHGTVLLRAELYDGDELVAAQTTAIEQRLLLPDGQAPYRFIFEHGASGPLVLALNSTYPANDDIVMMDSDEEAESEEDGDYVLSAVVVNDHGVALHGVRAVATLYNGEQFIGYRVVDIGTVEAGGETPLAIRWYGVRPGETIWNILTVTGNKNPSE